MKTTLVIDDQIMTRLRKEAKSRRTTISALVEAALRLLLDTPLEKRREVAPLPTFDMGESKVDLGDREALYRQMGGR